MGRFEFRKREIELDIAGVKVSVPGSEAFLKQLEEIGKKMVDFGGTKEAEDMTAAKDFVLDALDQLLGEEAMDQIEAERELDIYDCFDLFKYVTEEVKAYHQSRAAEHVQPVSSAAQPMALTAENRAACRARQRAERRKADTK